MPCLRMATQNGRLLPLCQLQPNISCAICRGYLIDATTITECMHTFCKSCLIQRLENIPSCPTCGIQLQRSKLSEQLRLDHAIQLLVYTAVPGLWQEEQRRRQYFSDHHPLTTSVAPVLQQPTYFNPSDPISLSLDFISTSRDEEMTNRSSYPSQMMERRYFRCPAAVTIHHFQKLLTLKFELSADYSIEIFYCNDKLDPSLRLMDVAYKYSWSQEEPLRLEYKMTRSSHKVTAASAASSNSSTNLNNNNNISSSSRSNNSTNQSCPGIKNGRKFNPANGRLRSATRQTTKTKVSVRSETEEKNVVQPEVSVPVTNRLNQEMDYKCRSHISQLSVYRTMHQVLKKKLPVLLSSKNNQTTTNHKKKKGKTKYHKRKSSENPVPERGHRKKVKRIENDKKILEKNHSPITNGDHWPRPNGVELLVKAAELASQQPATTPPPPRLTDKPSAACSAACTADQVEEKTNDECSTAVLKSSDRERTQPPIPVDENRSDQVVNVDENEMEADPSNKTDESVLVIVEEESPSCPLTQEEKTEEEIDKEETCCPLKLNDVALDLSSKSSRSLEENSSNPTGWNRPNKAVSPNLQRSALHSITDSLAQRQQRLMTLQQPKTAAAAVAAAATATAAVQHQSVNSVCSSNDTMRNLLTLSQTAALVASRTNFQPSHPERLAAQRLLAAMQRTFASFSAAAAAAGGGGGGPTLTAATPICIPRSETGSNNAKPTTKSFSYNFIRHPF